MTVILAKQNRSGPLDSGDINVAGQVNANTKYTFTALMNHADIVDPTLVLDFALFIDGALVYPYQWVGNTPDRDGVARAPTFFVSTGTPPLPTTVRLTVTLPRSLSFGLDLTLGSILA